MTESKEDYLETLLILEKKHPDSVRSVDIAQKIGYSKASVSKAMSYLKEEECVYVDERGFLHLTEKGRKTAEKVYERHVTFKRFFKEFCHISDEVAENDACRVEHVVSEETYQGIKKLLVQGV